MAYRATLNSIRVCIWKDAEGDCSYKVFDPNPNLLFGVSVEDSHPCCGIGTLSRFIGKPYSHDINRKELADKFHEALLSREVKVGFYTMEFIEGEYEAVKTALLLNGWRVLVEFTNPNTGNVITQIGWETGLVCSPEEDDDDDRGW